MKLYVARPSPFARKARIALLEKGLPHEVVVDNPWTAGEVRRVNPLGKVPALVLDGGRVVSDSKVIVEYLDTIAPPRLIPAEPEARVFHKQVEAIADGLCDAVVLMVLERARPSERQSHEWIARQAGKIGPALDALEQACGRFDEAALLLGELATGCALAYLDLRAPEVDWRAGRPGLVALHARLESRPSFAATRPAAQDLPAS